MERFSIHPLRAFRQVRHTGQLQASPPVVLAGSFLVLVCIGTLLLSLPLAQARPFGVFDALFTAASAVTVTGLMVIDPSRDLSLFGQGVVLALVQVGGIGFVTFAIIATLSVGKRVSLRYQALVQEAFNQTNVSRVRQTALSVLQFSLAIELAATLVLTLWWWRHEPLGRAFMLALFHSVSAFNNAGLSLFHGSMALFDDDPVTVFVITTCVILGGLGFGVLADIYRKRAWSAFAYYTRLMLVGTLLLNLFGFLLFWLIEAGNPGTLGALSTVRQGLAAWMQVVSARTAGFASIDVNELRDSSRFLLTGLMFIGGGSLSTASGIKLGTFIVLLAVVRAYILQRRDVVLMHRAIAQETIHKALALLVVSGLLMSLGIFLMTLFEHRPFLSLVMEVMSAFSTTGLSPDLTPDLGHPAQVLLMLLMFIGRLGPLTLVYSLGTQGHSRLGYPEASIQVG